jgi:prepilin-type N-terminal cleavage/methylation domain-containing protein/prepilin-type processing-associated H-X9-DG protein
MIASKHIRNPAALATRLFESGFTLTELLTVMFVTALLASLLLPAISRAKKTAKRISCANNNRQIGTALRMYVDDNRRYPVPGDSGLQPGHILREDYWDAKLLAYCKNNTNLFQCPSNPTTNNWTYVDSTTRLCPNRSYGYNGLGDMTLYDYNTTYIFGLGSQERAYSRSESEISAPSDMAAIGDMNLLWTDDDRDGDLHCDMLYLGLATYHSGANLSFCDGHVEHARTNTFKTQYERWNSDHLAHR